MYMFLAAGVELLAYYQCFLLSRFVSCSGPLVAMH